MKCNEGIAAVAFSVYSFIVQCMKCRRPVMSNEMVKHLWMCRKSGTWMLSRPILRQSLYIQFVMLIEVIHWL
jgi:hypothetical protein